ncbi:MAG: Ig-like protein [Bacteroidota bacterium]|jgi:gliding motility-associated-like protein|nr:Ig-like protein [Bacteroidota bacterium]
MRKILTLFSILLIGKIATAQQDAALAPPSGSFTAPVSGCALTSTENVTVRIFNFGPGTIVTPFNVSYSINGGAAVTEMVAAPNIPANTSFFYTFTTQADLSVPGSYSFDATVTLPGDPTPGNNTYTGYVVNAISPSVGGTITAPSSVCFSGNTGTLTLSGQTGNVLGWEYSTDGGGTWISIANTSTSQSYNNITVATKYRALVQNAGCTSVYSAIATVTVDPVTAGGSVSGTTTVCSGVNGATMTSTGRVGNILKWQYSTDGGVTWNDSAITTTSLTYSNLTTSTRYRVQVQSGSCNPAFSSAAVITVNPTSVGGTTSPAATTVCSGANSGTITLAGHTGSITRWEFSTDGGTTWTNITNTTTSQSYTNLTASTQYRARIQNSPCAAVYSAVADVTVAPASVGGTITSAATVCSGTNSGTLTLSGNAGTVQFWQFSTNGGTTYTNIANTTTTQTYTNLTATTIYRANVRNGSCTAVNSGTVTITVNPVSVGGSTTPNATVCSGSNSGTITLAGNTGSITGWESSTDGLSWSPIANTTASQSYTNLTATTYYRADVKSGVCSATTSSVDTITVNSPSLGGTVNSSGNICYGNNSDTLVLTGNTGAVLRWEYSIDGGINWNPIVNTTNSYVYTNLTLTTQYRAVIQNGTCPPVNSAAATLTIDPVSVGGTISGSITACGGSNSGSLDLIGYVGTVQNWESSTDGGATWTSIANTTATENYLNIVTTTIYRAIVRSGVCSQDTSAVATITVDPPTVGGTLSIDDTVCAGANAGTLTLAGYTGAIQHWESSTDGGSTWVTLANITATQAYTNLTTTTSYRVLVKSGVCNPATSNTITITVDPVANGGTINGGTSVCGSTNSGTLTLSGSVGTITGWESSTDGGATWTSIANTTTSQSYTNLTDTTWYRAIVMSGLCGSDTSSVAVIYVNPSTVGGTVSSNDTVCASGSGVLHLTGHTGMITGWELSTDGGFNWTPVTNATDSLIYNNVSMTTSYHAIVKSGVCSSDTSARATITVNPQVVGGTLNGTATVCDTLNSGTLNLTGSVGSIQNWESSTDGGATWTMIANTTTSYNYTNLTDTTWYRVIVMSGACGNDTSTTAVINVNPRTVGGMVTASDTVCASGSGVLHLTGQTGSVMGWEYSTDGGFNWTPVTNTTDSLVYNNLSITTSYHVIVKSGICNSDTSGRATITVNPQVAGGSLNGTTTVCDTINAGTLNLIGSVGTVQNWESSTDAGATWSMIANTTTTYTYTNLTDTTWFRVIVASGVCGNDTSTTAVIYVNPATVAGTLSMDDTVCSSTNNGVLHLTDYTGMIQGWEISTDGGFNWMALTNTTDSLSYNNLTGTTMYHAIVKSGICNSMISNNVTITVTPVSVAGTISGAMPGCESANGGTLTLAGNVGAVQNWESSIDGGLTWTAIANTTSSQTYSNLTDTTWYRVIVQSGVCSADTSSAATVIVYPKPDAVVTADTVCFGSPTHFTSTSTISSGFIQFSQWDLGDNNNSLAANPVHTYAAAGMYNVSLMLTSNLGCRDTASLTAVVNALPSNAITASGPLEFCSGDSVILSAATGTYTYMWSTADTTQSITVLTSGTYVVIITDSITGCSANNMEMINVLPSPVVFAGNDTSVSLGSAVGLNALGAGVVSWSWTPSTSLNSASIPNPEASPTETTTYQLVGTDVNGCTDKDSITVTVIIDYNIVISNLMTPNGDGYNDMFIVQNVENYPNTKVTVVSRTGQVVFKSDNYDNTWDAKLNGSGSTIADGTYYYFITMEGSDKVYKGAITVLKEGTK